MRFKRKLLILCCLLSQGRLLASESLGELIHSESTGTPLMVTGQQDNSRIYLKNSGAIWVTRDMVRVDPVLDVTVPDALQIENGALTSPASFNVRTNYSHYIARWELEIFGRHDVYYRQPLGLMSGNGMSNNQTITWDGHTADGDPHIFRSGDQFIYRLKVYDAEGNMDITTSGLTECFSGERFTKLDRLDNDDAPVFGKARLMRHNIPTSTGMAKFMGSGLRNVDRVKIGEDDFQITRGKLYGEKYLPTGAYEFPVTVTYKDGSKQEHTLYARIPKNYFAQTGIADLYIGKNFVSGNEDILANNYQYQDDIYNQGRLAYFGEAKVGDKWRFMAHFDSYEDELKNLFKHPFEADRRTVFEILDDDDPELYYGHYGDYSNIEKVVNTKGKVFLSAEYDKSSVLWGNYNTGFTGTETASYDRSLYGFRMDLRTRQTTEWGDDRAALTGFTAEADTAYAHDELVGTGTSVYFLRHGEVVPGSDKVYIRQIDIRTHQTLAQIALREGPDYDIDPFQGRIILNRPLPTRAFLNDQPLINDTLGGEAYNYLVVDYEYVPRNYEDRDNMTYGGRFKGWLSKHIGLGATYVNEDKDSQNYELTGGDLTLRFTEGSYIKVEYAESKGIQADTNFVSEDGGITFTPADTNRAAREGSMTLVTSHISLHDMAPELFGAAGNDIGFWYREKEPGFSFASQFDDLEQKSSGGRLRLQFADRVQFVTRHQNTDEKKPTGEQQTDTEETEVELGWRMTEHLKVTAAWERINELDLQKIDKSDADLVGLRFDYIHDQSSNIYLKGQKTIDSSDNFAENDSVTFGTQWKLLRNLNLAGDYTTGDRGETTQLALGFDNSQVHNTYVSWLNNDYEGKNNVVFGQKGNLTDNLSAFQENQFVDENNGKGRVDSFGFNYRINDLLQSGVSFQQGRIKNPFDNEEIKRTAGSLYWVFDNTETFFSNKFEVRSDRGKEEIDQYVTINRYIQQLTLAHTLYGKFNFTKTRNRTTDDTIQRFIEGSVGLAYRPVTNDRWNLLGRYTYLVDFDRRPGTRDHKDEKAHIAEAETIYDLNQYFDIGSKAAWKKKQGDFLMEDGTALPSENNIYLLALSTSYHLMKSWDIMAEYHWKTDHNTKDVMQGALLSVNKLLGKNFKLGIGYNFSDFHDDLVHKDDYEAHGFFINLLGVF